MELLKISPIINLPFLYDYFFYYSSEKAPLGSVVEINLHNRKCFGLVLKVDPLLKMKKIIKESNYPLKKINQVILDFPVINYSLLKVAKFLSLYYYCSLPLALKTIFPSNLKSFFNFLKKEKPTTFPSLAKKEPKKENEININFLEITSLKNLKEKINSFFDNQVLFLAPTYFHLLYFKNIFPQGVIFQKKDGKKNFKIFKEILEGKPLLILGTRSAVFLPFQNLKAVIVVEPENVNYKSYQQKPFYNAARIAQKLAFYHQSELIFFPYESQN
ncbi:MAG: hypothetical protein AB7D02_00395 [Candidatus Paceibacterota bacterium]